MRSPLVAEAFSLQADAREHGLTLRLIGSLAIGIRCPSHETWQTEMGRRAPVDIDLVGYQREAKEIERLLETRGYELHPSVRHSREFGLKRLIYTHPSAHKIDIFLDDLVMAHTITFVGRLEAETVTVSLADLLLSKLQIHQVTENDLIDLLVLLAAKEFGAGPVEIDLAYVVSVLSADWGFYTTAMGNLAKLEDAVARHAAPIGSARPLIETRLEAFRHAVAEAPKSRRWRLRARIGTRLPWYEHVDDVDR